MAPGSWTMLAAEGGVGGRTDDGDDDGGGDGGGAGLGLLLLTL